jgi:hypothetical protein
VGGREGEEEEGRKSESRKRQGPERRGIRGNEQLGSDFKDLTLSARIIIYEHKATRARDENMKPKRSAPYSSLHSARCRDDSLRSPPPNAPTRLGAGSQTSRPIGSVRHIELSLVRDGDDGTRARGGYVEKVVGEHELLRRVARRAVGGAGEGGLEDVVGVFEDVGEFCIARRHLKDGTERTENQSGRAGRKGEGGG